MLEFDSTSKEVTVVLTHGVSISARQSHTAVAFKQSMVVYGGISESGVLHQDMLAFNFEEREWTRVKVSGSAGNHFYQGAACTVLTKKSHDSSQSIRKVSLLVSNLCVPLV